MATSNGRYLTFATKAMVDITGTLLVPPLVALALRGLYNESQVAGPLFAVTLLLALVLSLIAVVAKIRRYGQAYQQLLDSEHQPGRSGS